MGRAEGPGWETAPLFAEPPVRGDAGDKGGDGPTRSVAFGRCPRHRDERRTGLVRTASHLVWRQHYVRTWSGSSIPCPASAVALCVLPDAEHEQVCDCERGTRWRASSTPR